MGWWPFTWPRRGKPRTRPEIVLYSRHGCHLCVEAEALLRERQRRFGYALAEIDVDANPELVKQYGECVPVVLVDGKLRFRGKVEPALLDRLLKASP